MQLQRSMKIYAISGLGADERAFQFLDVPFEVVHVRWIDPQPDESLNSYALRLSQQIDTSEPFALVGLSFGGMLATEMCKFINPAHTILVSSAETRKGLPWWFRMVGTLNATRLIPNGFMEVPRPVAAWFFGTKNTELLSYILDDVDVPFTKWAVRQIMKWDNQSPATNVLKIGGQADRVLPPKRDSKTIILKNAGHFMVVDKAEQISHLIKKKLTV